LIVAAAEMGRDEIAVEARVLIGVRVAEALAGIAVEVEALAGIAAEAPDGTVAGARALVEVAGLGGSPEWAACRVEIGVAACRAEVGVVAWVEAEALVLIVAVPGAVVARACIAAAQDGVADWGLGELRAELDAWVGFGDGCSVRRDVLRFEPGESVESAGVRWVGRGEFRAGRDVFQRG